MESSDIEPNPGAAASSGDFTARVSQLRPARHTIDLRSRSQTSASIRIAQLRRDRDRLLALVKKERQQMRKLWELVDRDPLTGMLNRRGFARAVQTAAAHVQRFGGDIAMIYLDLDGFKAVNDMHGHGVGDRVLTAISMRLSARLRKVDVVARLGGDEFAILVWNFNGPTSQGLTEELARIVTDVAHELNVARELTGASIGVTKLTPEVPFDELLQRADAEMYLNKRKRRP